MLPLWVHLYISSKNSSDISFLYSTYLFSIAISKTVINVLLFLQATILFFAVAVSFIVAAPSATEEIRKLPALVHEEVHDKSGQYSLQYVTAEGTVVIEKGRLVPNPDGEGLVMVVEGEVIFIGDDGKTYKTVYTAGFDGYKVVGDHIPVAPAVPAVPVSAVPVTRLAY